MVSAFLLAALLIALVVVQSPRKMAPGYGEVAGAIKSLQMKVADFIAAFYDRVNLPKQGFELAMRCPLGGRLLCRGHAGAYPQWAAAD